MFSGLPPKTTSRTYVNDEQGFQFEPPRGWMIKEDRSEGVTLTLPGKGITLLHVYAMEASELVTMLDNNEKKQFEKKISSLSGMTGIEKISKPKFTYYDDGAKATFSITSITDGTGKSGPRGQMTIWVSQDNSKMYFMLYASDKYTFNTNLSTIKNVQKSFYVFPI